jgi:hypothetical protein
MVFRILMRHGKTMKRTAKPEKAKHTAQTMIELAVFGGVLFFLIGGIASNYISASFQQNAQMKAMRLALSKSYGDTKVGNNAQERSKKHVGASVTIFEDRLTGDFGKYGTVDRQPVVIGSGGMFTTQSMQPVQWTDPDNMPVMDLEVNGQSFEFKVSTFVQYVVLFTGAAGSISGGTDANSVQIIRMRPASKELGEIEEITYKNRRCPDGTNCLESFTGISGLIQCTQWSPCPAEGKCPITTFACSSDGECVSSMGACEKVDVTETNEKRTVGANVNFCKNNGSSPSVNLLGSTNEEKQKNCNFGTVEQRTRLAREWSRYPQLPDYPVFFTKMMANDPNFNAPDILSQANETSLLYNLRRDGDPAHAFPRTGNAPVAWRWKGNTFSIVAKKETNIFNDTTSSYDMDGDLDEETLYEVVDATAEFCCSGSACGGEENAFFKSGGQSFGCRLAYYIRAQDAGAAEVDPSKSAKDYISDIPAESHPEQIQGMSPDWRIYGRTGCVRLTTDPADVCTGADSGTFLDVKEGKLFLDGKPVSTSTVKKNQFDVVERKYQLNTDMLDPNGFANRFPNKQSIETTCYSAATGTSCCMATDAISQKTCFDKTTKTLYIRSRLSDKRGHKWMTDTSQSWDKSLGAK